MTTDSQEEHIGKDLVERVNRDCDVFAAAYVQQALSCLHSAAHFLERKIDRSDADIEILVTLCRATNNVALVWERYHKSYYGV